MPLPHHFLPALLAAFILAAAAAGTAHAHPPATPDGHDAAHAEETAASAALDEHTRQDIARHLGMARAHEAAAQCLQSGAPHAACQKQLQAQCKGLALGKYCGMRHVH